MGIRMKTLGVVDNDRFALCALKAYLDQTLDGITLAWMTEHANTAIARCVTGERPDVLLVDMSMRYRWRLRHTDDTRKGPSYEPGGHDLVPP